MNPIELAQAGAIVVQAEPKLDAVSARAYRHPALGERQVVRLVGDTLGTAEDLTLEFHGFTLESSAPVGYGLRKGLGFPAWALLNDPEHAAYALEVVKEFRAQARLARSRPGAAKDGFDGIAQQLGRSVPHFLPSFYEEAARVFLEHGNSNMATTMFGKARQAEKVSQALLVWLVLAHPVHPAAHACHGMVHVVRTLLPSLDLQGVNADVQKLFYGTEAGQVLRA